MIDTHCHLELKEFERDRKSVIERARSNGIDAIITVGTDLEDCYKAIRIADEFDIVYVSCGIHPHEAKNFSDSIEKELTRLLRHRKVVAIGETGLDYYRDYSPRDKQRDVFRRHLELSMITGLPVIIHMREALDDTMKILEEFKGLKGVFHCFSGDLSFAKKVIEMGFFISIAGPVTYLNAKKLPEIVQWIPDEYLLIETDAPYLAPEPVRAGRNEPSYLIHTAKKVAQLREVSLEDIDRVTTLNAKRLFRMGSLPEPEIAYRIRDNLYLNITTRCTNACLFCVRFHTDYVKGHNLRLREEPSIDEIIDSIKDPSIYNEIVFCGYGEPLIRLDVVKEVSRWIKEHGGRVRINTNGEANLIHKRNILPELEGLVDVLSVSLNAPDSETYDRICRPLFSDAFTGVLDFIKEAKKYIPRVIVTAVEMPGLDMERIKRLAVELGLHLRIRRLDVVG